ncbi:hypothetical protein RPB_3177 [Rhodopseudomonas palustris HaA2]|uniref:Uncharacterized protein n=1 Tax=Rhodopseudomonas palustris (strain HaA2) TaxID=316058 RepID=Q2IV87_RHOP2|nr:hypothetical protein [Rhodopseudomonas palustris]ABD07873.1 hypothetical protein RPB_3177 [Rhodopseudomonas palustris HaA2]
MPLSIVRSDGPDALDASEAPPLPAELIVLSFSDAALARYARVWHHAGCKLPQLHLANAARLSLDQSLRTAVASARGVMIQLPHGLDDWRDGVETLAALAREQRIALAIVAETDDVDPRLAGLSNLPRSTLRRLATLCRGRDDAAARAVLTQLSLAAGLTIAPWLDQPAQPTAEPIREAVR